MTFIKGMLIGWAVVAAFWALASIVCFLVEGLGCYVCGGIIVVALVGCLGGLLALMAEQDC